jgi:hypothetical protein
MTQSSSAKLPPARVVRVVESMRRRIQALNRMMAPAQVGVLEMINGNSVTQAIYTAAKFAIPDALANGPLTAQQIANRVGANPDATYRLLRALATLSLCTELPGRRFRLTPMGAALRSDTPNSMRGIALATGHPEMWAQWGELAYSVETGKPAVDKLHGMSLFEYAERNPDVAQLINDGMTAVSTLENPPILAAYNFSRFGTIVDVGGGHGLLLAAILQHAPNARGVLYDLESVVAGAQPILEAAGVLDRCTIESGSFFDSVPPGGDAYMLKHIVHDWAEPEALEILGNVRRVMNPDGTLLLVEIAIPPDNTPHFGKLLDLQMLVQVTGKERTAEQYAELLDRAGFRQTRVVPTVAPISVIEAVPT